MSNWHGYFGIEDLDLTAEQRQTLIAQLRTLGQANGDLSPQLINHHALRPDGKAAIFEALWDEDNINVTAVKNRLAAIFGVDPSSITTSTNQQSFAGYSTSVVTFARGTPKLRLALFAGLSSSWAGSRQEATGYFVANFDDWQPAE